MRGRALVPKVDLVQKLRTWKGHALTHVVLAEAADEIERLRAENARLLGGGRSRSGPADIPALDDVDVQDEVRRA